VEAIRNLATPCTKRELRRFIGMINYYRDMWAKRSHMLAPLTSMTSATDIWKWTDEHQKAFKNAKWMLAAKVLLAYPDFNAPFQIHTDASDLQLGAVISQNNKPIAFYSRKLNPAQRNYTTTERELLAILETLKEFKNILLGQEIIVHTDHKNLMYKNFNTERVMRWRLIIKEFGPTFEYTPVAKNVVANTISRLEENYNKPEVNKDLFTFVQHLSNLETNTYDADKITSA
jgi:hypothetical protein